MSQQLSLPDLARRARAVLDHLNAPPPDGATEEEEAARERLRRAADTLTRRVAAPVAFGVVGPFNVGKSLLLGTMLRWPGLLPVEDQPTTGNITVLTLRQGTAGQGTGLLGTNATVSFMSPERLAASVQEIVVSMVDRIHKDRPDLGAQAALAGFDPVLGPNGWSAFDAWHRRLWEQPPAGQSLSTVDPVHQGAARELCRIRDAHRGQQGLLGSSVSVAVARVRGAMELDPPTAPTGQPPLPRQLNLRLETISEDLAALHACLPLVERIELSIAVDPQLWDLEQEFGAPVVQLVDFPGIGAAGSYGRDRHLSREALKDMHSILVVLPTDKLPSKDAQDFWNMLTADQRTGPALETAALVAAGKFDGIARPIVNGVPDGLAAGLDRVWCLRSLNAFAPEFVGTKAATDRIHLVSPARALLREGQSLDGVSPRTLAVIEHVRISEAAERGLGWERYADDLDRAAPGNPWTVRLRAYEEDGGIGALRRAIAGHVKRYGGAQKLERARRAGDEVLAALKDLRKLRRARSPLPQDAYLEAAERFQELRELLDTVSSDFAAMRTGATAGGYRLVGPPPPRADAVAAQVRAAVADGEGWAVVLNRARLSTDLLVPRTPAPRPAAPDDFVDPLAPKPSEVSAAGHPGDSTEAVERDFLAVLKRFSTGGQELVRLWLDDWLAYWEPEFEPLREWIDSDADSAALLPSLFIARTGDPGALGMFSDRLGLRALVEGLKAHTPRLFEGGVQEAGERFPLQRAHAQPWHSRAIVQTLTADERNRHPLAVLQMRAEVADAAADHTTLRLHQALRRVQGFLQQRLDLIATGLLEPGAFEPGPPPSAREEPDGDPSGPGPDPYRGQDGGAPDAPAPTVDDLFRYWNPTDPQGA
ncbi:hypothetical protein ACIRBX_01100 [Kitasatospora sp. NPDC096147]|uniref:hypothetical protein n=1 Tax=Kitasatospora sp. NPDC096147 TaxID=3364093 RepID=UPI00382E829C